MKDRGVFNATDVITAVDIVIGALVSTFILKEVYLGGNPEEEGELEISITPTQLGVGGAYSTEIIVTNNEPGNMTIREATYKRYRDNKLLKTETAVGANLLENFKFITTSISSEETKTILSNSDLKWSDNAGNWKVKIFLDTNYGTLQDSVKLTVQE